MEQSSVIKLSKMFLSFMKSCNFKVFGRE